MARSAAAISRTAPGSEMSMDQQQAIGRRKKLHNMAKKHSILALGSFQRA